MMPLRISRLRFGLTPRRFGGTALSIDANCSSLSQNRSAIVLLHGNRSVESGLLESGQALETWELGFEPSSASAADRWRWLLLTHSSAASGSPRIEDCTKSFKVSKSSGCV